MELLALDRPYHALAILLLGGAVALSMPGCATESHRALTPPATSSRAGEYSGPKAKLVIGKFRNRSTYLNGVFSDGSDRLGNQAKTILAAHLQQSGRFVVVDRDNLEQLSSEAQRSGSAQKFEAAEFAVTGDVTEFGRKTTGDRQLFGILGAGKRQAAYSKVTLNVVDVGTSKIVYSVQGAGEYALSNRELVGFGGTASYDSTLNGKVLNLAIMEAVDRLAEGLERSEWTPSTND